MLTESQEQQKVFQWSWTQLHRFPELCTMFAVPNGGKRNIRTAARMKKEGVKPGVPDIFLPVARGSFHGLFIEMKRRGGTLTHNQIRFINDVISQGFNVFTCYGADEAISRIEAYLKGR